MQALWAEGNAMCSMECYPFIGLVGRAASFALHRSGSQYLVSEEHDWLAHRSGRQGSVGVTHVLGERDRASHQAGGSAPTVLQSSPAQAAEIICSLRALGFERQYLRLNDSLLWNSTWLLLLIIPACINILSLAWAAGRIPNRLVRVFPKWSDLGGSCLKESSRRVAPCLSSTPLAGILLCVEGFRVSLSSPLETSGPLGRTRGSWWVSAIRQRTMTMSPGGVTQNRLRQGKVERQPIMSLSNPFDL